MAYLAVGTPYTKSKWNHDPRSGGYPNFTLALTDKPEFAGSILPDISDGNWTLDDDGDTVASKYFFYPATRKFTVTFLFPTALDSPQDYAVEVQGFQNASRTPSIGGDWGDLFGLCPHPGAVTEGPEYWNN